MPEFTYQPCPVWCTSDHQAQDRFERYVDPVMDLRTHSVDVAKIANQGGNLKGEIMVDVSVTDDLNNGDREGPLVSVSGAECMMPATAAAVAHAVMEATRVAGGRAADPCGRLAADLQGAIDQYPDGKIPSTHLRLILTRYRSRCADPRPAAAAHSEWEGRVPGSPQPDGGGGQGGRQ